MLRKVNSEMSEKMWNFNRFCDEVIAWVRVYHAGYLSAHNPDIKEDKDGTNSLENNLWLIFSNVGGPIHSVATSSQILDTVNRLLDDRSSNIDKELLAILKEYLSSK